MKKIFYITAIVLFSGLAFAKYNMPDDVKPRSEKTANYQFGLMDKEKKGQITLEEYKSLPVTRDVELQNRKAKEKRTYKTPEEEFKIMDKDNDGFITKEDLAEYLKTKPVY